jgi:hypothetical protein
VLISLQRAYAAEKEKVAQHRPFKRRRVKSEVTTQTTSGRPHPNDNPGLE